MILACFIGLIPFIVLLATLKTADQGLLLIALCGRRFFGNMTGGPFLGVPAEVFTPEVYGKAVGFVNGVGYTFAGFCAKIFAALVVVDSTGIRGYSYGWYFIALCVFLGIVAATQIKARKSVTVDQGVKVANA